jgi:carboxypeptidase Q
MNFRQPLLTAVLASLCATGAVAQSNDPATLAKIRDAAMASDWSYQRLEDMTDLVGPRLSGSPGAAAAVEQVAEAMRKLGAKVTLQPVKVPHWVRGEEKAQLVEYTGRPKNVTQNVVLTALGGSSATPAAGLTAQVIVVRSFEELKERAADVKGRIVLFDVAFDQGMADRGRRRDRPWLPNWGQPLRWCVPWAAPTIGWCTPASRASTRTAAFRQRP